jgi:hypothetical protein
VFRHELGKPETKELVRMGDDDIDITDDEYNDYLSEILDKHWLGDEYEPQYTWTDDNDAIFSTEWEKSFKQEVTWKDIKAQAETHPALKAIVDQMMTVYHLSKEEDNNGN